MNFDIIGASVSAEKWRDSEQKLALSMELVPHGPEYIEFGDKHILSALGYLPMHGKDRVPVSARVYVTTSKEQLEHLAAEEPICGYAQFFPDPEANLAMALVVEPRIFEQMLRTNIPQAAAATLNLDIEDLSFGWEPDGSHQIWKLDHTSDSEKPTRRLISGYRYSVETFWTSEQSILEAEEDRSNARLADSHDPNARKLAASLAPQSPSDALVRLLQHCRALLWALLGLGAIMLLRSHN